MAPKNGFGFPGGLMCIRKCINSPVEHDALLNTPGVIKFFFTLDKITDHVAGEYLRMVKGQVCVR